MQKFTFFFVLSFFVIGLSAREGMWVPIFLEKYNEAEMQQMGFRLSADDIYDVNNASMKDAVVHFGGGCTGELISGDGLLITNHHCGYRQIQQHSSVENDYLTDGFWAKNRQEELPNPGLTVRFLDRMEDVTGKVLEGTSGLNNQAEIDKVINRNIAAIMVDAQAKGKFQASVRPIFYGNQYILHVYKVYTDVRLVGAPPSAIGKFGGDTDNWMWPRHTGDFALFRVYAGKDNEPAAYSLDNVPLKPKKFFPISLKGVEPGDFTMIFGYPGRTTQYLPSYAIELIREQRNPDRIAVRDLKLEIMERFMNADHKVRIQYASKQSGVANSWKRWQGENRGLDRLDAVTRKTEYENQFKDWAIRQNRWDNEYKPLFDKFRSLYSDYAPVAKASDHYAEIVNSGIEIFSVAGYINALLRQIDRQDEVSESAIISINQLLTTFFKDFHQPLDEEIFTTLLPVLYNNLPIEYLPSELGEILRRYQGEKLISKFYRKSILNNQEKLNALLSTNSVKRIKSLQKDPVFRLFKALRDVYDSKILPPLQVIEGNIDASMKHFVAGLMEMNSDKAFYPDANSTLRVGYGLIEGYEPKDGISYTHITTLDGVMGKMHSELPDYEVPKRLIDLYNEKDYGIYGDNGQLPVCFIASNHTSGGNSGSPILNADGHLIGINFDRCWEGTMSDIMYDPEQCRNISIDIRYALFIIDKFAGASYLLDEMELIR